MNKENDKYSKVVEMIRKTKPQPESTEAIAREVFKRIHKRPALSGLQNVIDLLFSWIYVGWIRKSLVTASAVIVLFFIYQQGMIMKKIDLLSRQVTVSNTGHTSVSTAEIEKFLTSFGSSGRKFPAKVEVTEKQADDIIRSLDDLRNKYKELEDLIESDPKLKKLVEQRLLNDSIKFNL
jgi:hypothetical protein